MRRLDKSVFTVVVTRLVLGQQMFPKGALLDAIFRRYWDFAYNPVRNRLFAK